MITLISDDCSDNGHSDYMHVNIYSNCCIVVAVRVKLVVVMAIVIVMVIMVMMETLELNGIDSVGCNDNRILLIIMIRGSDRNGNIAYKC